MKRNFITGTIDLKKEKKEKQVDLSGLISEECNNDTFPALGVSSIAHHWMLSPISNSCGY